MDHDSGIKHPMSLAAINADTAASWAERLERRERERSGLPLHQARPVVARKLGIAPGTLENLRRGRIKDPRQSLFDRLRTGVIRELEAEMRRLETEIHVLRQIGSDPRDDEITAAETDLASIRAALGLGSPRTLLARDVSEG